MKIRRTKITLKTKTLVAFRSRATAETRKNSAQIICPLCQNPLDALPAAETDVIAFAAPVEHDACGDSPSFPETRENSQKD